MCRVALDDDSAANSTRDIARLAGATVRSRGLEVLDHLGVLLERLDFVTTLDHTDAELGQEVTSTVRVIVHATVKCRSRVLAKACLDEVTSSRVLIHELCDIVDEARDDDEVALLRLFLELVPSENWQVVARRRPLDGLGHGSELLDRHGHLTLFDLVICSERTVNIVDTGTTSACTTHQGMI